MISLFVNLIVNAQPKILKWDPDNPANCDTTFSYSLSSAQKKNCSVTINIHNLDVVDNEGKPLLVYQTTLTNLCPGNYSFTWDGTNNQTPYPPNNIAEKGLYTFDIIVQGSCPYDGDRMRSSALAILEHESEWLSGCPLDRGATDLYYVKYRLQDTRPAYKAGVEVYDPELSPVGNFEDGTAITPIWNDFGDKLLRITSQTMGTYRFVFWAIDDHPETDKAHRRKPALEVNKDQQIHSGANCYISEKLYGSTKPAAERSAKFQRMAGYKKWACSPDDKKLEYYDMVIAPQSALDIIKPLRRVAVFSWYVHGLNKSLGGIIPFGDSWLAPSRDFLRQILPRLGSQYATATVDSTSEVKINGKRVYLISELFYYDPYRRVKNDLSNLVCVFIINCSADEQVGNEGQNSTEVYPWGSIQMIAEMAKSYPLYDPQGNIVDWLKGANFAGTIVGCDPGNVSELRGAFIPVDVAGEGAECFWKYASQGYSLDVAIDKAAEAMNSAYEKHAYGPTWAKFGPQTFKAVYCYNLWGYPFLHQNGKPWGGRTEEELKLMGKTP
ncbi:hypothetical protein H5T87_08175 [bacterium]|nr:hypothetical protein [bacterium]